VSGTLVTARDLATGESEAREITNDYIIICDGLCYVDGVQVYGNGTTVVTLKVRKEPAA
jgi:hypothetical protein